jgi:hypothetical protein
MPHPYLSLFAAACLGAALVGCSGADPNPEAGDVAAEEDDLRRADILGTYGPSGSLGGSYYSEAKIKRSGSKTLISFDVDVEYELKRTGSGAYVFTSGEERDGYCDDPDCYYISKIHGVVYPKVVGSVMKPTVKFTLRKVYLHPTGEDGIPVGEVSTTHYFFKAP